MKNKELKNRQTIKRNIVQKETQEQKHEGRAIKSGRQDRGGSDTLLESGKRMAAGGWKKERQKKKETNSGKGEDEGGSGGAQEDAGRKEVETEWRGR